MTYCWTRFARGTFRRVSANARFHTMRKAINHLTKADPKLAEVIRKVGPYRMKYHDPDFASMARSIVFQQLNGKAAASIYARFEAGCRGCVTPEAVMRLRPARLRNLGLSPQKSEYVRDLSKRTLAGEIDFAELPKLSDEEILRTLTAVKGIGVWTVHMFLIFALKRPDVLPVGDYGVRSAMKRLYGLADLPKPAEMETIAGPWQPWRSVASWYLWRSLEGPVLL
jgi:DNA-3-methyladenine glycosylase II